MQSIVCDGCGSSVAGNQDNLPILKTVTYAGKSYDVFVRVNISGKNSDLCPSCSSAAAHVAGALL